MTSKKTDIKYGTSGLQTGQYQASKFSLLFNYGQWACFNMRPTKSTSEAGPLRFRTVFVSVFTLEEYQMFRNMIGNYNSIRSKSEGMETGFLKLDRF